jgi:cation diffusion facilitator CzcD-associated flavoprotein CzcO
VCVIGAGASGLVTTKRLLDYGIPVECFESGSQVGGTWAFRNSNGHSSAYRSLHIDTSKERLSLSDFPISRSYPDFPHHTQIKEYLEQYCDAFGLREHIILETRVEHCEHLPGGGWAVTISDGTARNYDMLVVANGHHWDPRWPNFPGEFDGPQIHSHAYIDPSEPIELRGKRVLVVGIGNSAADIVSELAQRSQAAKVFLSTRSGSYVIPKYLLGRPLDQLFRTIPQLPLGPQRRLLQLLQPIIWGRMERYGLPTPNHRFLEAHLTTSSELLVRFGSGDVVAKPDVAALEGDRVRFVDDSIEPLDAIIYATGYNVTFPFFDPSFISAPNNAIRLYKRVFKPGLDDAAFIGFTQALPTLFPFIECQADLLSRYLAGSYRPPGDAEMDAVITADDHKFTAHFRDSARHTQEHDYYVYEHELRTREIPAGARRAQRLGPIAIAGRARSCTSRQATPEAALAAREDH